MKCFIRILWVAGFLFFLNCKSKGQVLETSLNPADINAEHDFTIAFGSCNKQNVENILWKEVLKHQPDLWIWGGDNIYSDSDDREKLWKDYQTQLAQPVYQELQKTTKIMATWDDHDYGLNDGGTEFYFKDESQQLFLDFLGFSIHDKRRKQAGIYHSEVIEHKKGSIKIIILDTRYFRSALTDDTLTKKRYKPNAYGQGTILGAQQWAWLEQELKASKADFNIIVSSVQFLSKEHGFETWGNFPHEVDKLIELIKSSKAKGVLLLSGDRHISEFSRMTIQGLKYPLVDFTSSGLTHSYKNFSGEENPLRIGNVISNISFGLLRFNFGKNEILMQMRGENDVLLQDLVQKY